MTSVSSAVRVRTVGAVIVVAGILVGLSGCAAGDGGVPTPSSSPAASATWSYGGANGPEHWGEIAEACAPTPTSHQSPVDIVAAELAPSADASAATVHYAPASFAVENNGHAIEAVAEDTKANSVELGGQTYYLQQFHFHASSEHTIDGAPAAAELHLVHASDSGELAVFGALIETGEANTALAELFDSIPESESMHGEGGKKLSAPIDPAALLPASGPSARYTGSLTTPGCAEGVSWSVYLTPITVSEAQLAALTSVYADNHRPVQPLNGREVSRVGGL
ncbi:carbonic anhydrase [Leifsonia sp. McL0607]|uniref:carbonic anhydrase n=1 Tax=Leifsonia sp. McL0607 TaxID=3415672 RepID=UPI003CE72510